MRVPSGDQSGSVLRERWPGARFSAALLSVSCWAPAPSMPTTHISDPLVKAMRVPSGENLGSRPRRSVSCRKPDPSRFAMKMCEPAAKAIRLQSGDQSRSTVPRALIDEIHAATLVAVAGSSAVEQPAVASSPGGSVVGPCGWVVGPSGWVWVVGACGWVVGSSGWVCGASGPVVAPTGSWARSRCGSPSSPVAEPSGSSAAGGGSPIPACKRGSAGASSPV